MKHLKIASAVLLALAILQSLGVLTATAQGPSVAYLDNQYHAIPAGGSALYRFDYALNNDTGERPVTTITLVNGTNSGVLFQVWTPETVNDMADNKPIGIGTPQSVDCNSGELNGSGGCQSPDLIWSGAFGSGGTYYVLVTNTNNAQTQFLLKIQGTGVSLGQQQVASAPSAPAVAPNAPAAAPALPVANPDDPAKAIAIDSKSHTIAANSVLWYSFSYGILDDGTHPVQIITLVNGNQPGQSFAVYAPETMNGGWWNNNPTGRGTAVLLDCSTGEVAGQGGCSSNDLTWRGALGMNGIYYVRVVNNNGAPMNVTLTIQ